MLELFEDADADIRASHRADNVRIAIYNYLHTHYYETDKKLPKAGLPGAMGVGLTGREMGIEGCEDLLFVFGPRVENPQHVKLNVHPDDRHKTDIEHMIAIWAVTTDVQSVMGALLSFNGADHFLHEFNHYLDSKRFKGDAFANGSYRTLDFTLDDYHNDTAEQNAFFHNIAEPLLGILRNYREMGPDILEILDPLPKDFRTFFTQRIAKLRGVYARHWKHLTEPNKRRVISRLYALFQEYQKIRTDLG